MTFADLIDDLFKRYPALGPMLEVLIVLIIIAVGIFILLFIIAFFTGKPLPYIPRKSDQDGSSSYQRSSAKKSTLTVKDLPKNTKQLEKLLNQVTEKALSHAKAEQKEYDALITLLNRSAIYNNVVLKKLVDSRFEPYESWVRGENTHSGVFDVADSLIEYLMFAITEITAHSGNTSIPRSSITLLSKDGFLHMARSNAHTASKLHDKIFKIGDTQDCGVAGYVAYTQRSRNVGDISKDRFYKKFQSTPVYSSLLTVPLMLDDQIIGTFSIDSAIKNAFTEIDVNRVELFAQSIATAIAAVMVDDFIKSTRTILES